MPGVEPVGEVNAPPFGEEIVGDVPPIVAIGDMFGLLPRSKAVFMAPKFFTK